MQIRLWTPRDTEIIDGRSIRLETFDLPRALTFVRCLAQNRTWHKAVNTVRAGVMNYSTPQESKRLR